MKNVKKWIAGGLASASLVGGEIGTSALSSVSTYAAEYVRAGNAVYRMPSLTATQSQQLSQAASTLNRGMKNHLERVSFQFDGYTHFTKSEQIAIVLKVYREAFNRNRDEFQNGQYMRGNVLNQIYNGYSGNQLTFYLKYHITAEQDAQAWQTAQKLVKELNISANQSTGMKQIYDYICANYSYDDATSSQENLNDTRTYKDLKSCPGATAYGAFQTHRCNCTGYAQMFYLMCRAMGWNKVYVAVNKQGTHAYNAVVTNGKVEYVDTCFGAYNSIYKSVYYMVSQSKLDLLDAQFNSLNFTHPGSQY